MWNKTRANLKKTPPRINRCENIRQREALDLDLFDRKFNNKKDFDRNYNNKKDFDNNECETDTIKTVFTHGLAALMGASGTYLGTLFL